MDAGNGKVLKKVKDMDFSQLVFWVQKNEKYISHIVSALKYLKSQFQKEKWFVIHATIEFALTPNTYGWEQMKKICGIVVIKEDGHLENAKELQTQVQNLMKSKFEKFEKKFQKVVNAQ